MSIFYGDFLRAKWKLFDNDYIKENNIARYSLLFYIPLKTLEIRSFWHNNSISFDDWLLHGIGLIGIYWAIYLIASIEELIIAVTMKQYEPFRKSIFSKSQR